MSTVPAATSKTPIDAWPNCGLTIRSARISDVTPLDFSRRARAMEQRKLRFSLILAGAILLFLGWRSFFP